MYSKKSVKTLLFTITVLVYLHRQGASSAILYREVSHMLHANYQPNWPNGSGEEVV